MKKRILSVFLILAMLTGLFAVLPVVVVADTPTVWDGSTAAAFAGGDGTEANPYQISNGAELAYLAAQVNGGTTTYEGQYLVLTNDIVLNSGNASTWESSAPANNFTAIGTWSSAFGGNFDGNGKTISGIYINANTDSHGLFGVIQGGAVIENFALVNSYISGGAGGNDGNVAAIVGQTNRASATDIRIYNIFVDAIIIGNGAAVGGIIGNLSNSTMSSNTITWEAGKVYLDRVTFIGSVSADNYAAGLIGDVRNVKLEATNCLVYADIIATSTDNGQYSAGFFARSKSSLNALGSNYQQVATNCIFAGKSVAASKSTKYNRAYISSSNGTNKPLAESCYNAVAGLSTMRYADTDDENAPSYDISANKLYSFYAGAEAIDWATWGSTNWASKSLDIMRPAGVAENFDIIPFTIGELETGASVRLSDPTGLRFTATVDKDDLAMFASVTGYGIVIAPTSYVEAAGAFTMAALDNLAVAEGSKYLKIEAEKLVEDTAEHVVFSAVIGNIKAANYAVDFSAIVYVEADGAVYYSAYNATANSRSIRTVATAAFNDRSATQVNEYQYEVAENDYSPYTEAQRAVLASFMG